MSKKKPAAETDGGRDTLETIINSLFFPFYVVDAQTYRIEAINEAARKGRDVGDMTCHLLTHQNPVPCDSGSSANSSHRSRARSLAVEPGSW